MMRYPDKITVQQLIATPTGDELGDGVDLELGANWETYHEPFATVTARGGREFERFGIINAEVSHVFTVRNGSETLAVTSQNRIVIGTRRFEITASYVPVSRSREVRFEATEIK
jgi:head-tail adaptor